MIDLSENFDTKAMTENDLWRSEISLKASGRNKFLFGWPFTAGRNGNSPYSLLKNKIDENSIFDKRFTTVSDTNLGKKTIRWKENVIPDFKYPKFIPIYDTSKTPDTRLSFNSMHPIPWFDIEASCVKMEQYNTIADLSRYLAEGKLYAVNDIPKKEIKKLESRSDTSVNLDDAYSDEDVMTMYRVMKEVRKERKKLMKSKEHKVRSSSSATSLSSLELSFDTSVDEKSFLRNEKCGHLINMENQEGNAYDTDNKHMQSLTVSADTGFGDEDLENITDLNRSLAVNLSVDETTQNVSKPSPHRFGEANEKHCEGVSKLVKRRLFLTTKRTLDNDSDPIVDLYVELVDGRIRPLCHIKTGMASLCLNTFFFPCTNVASVTWVSNIQEAILRNLFKKFDPLKDIFGQHVSRLCVSDYKAVLFVSKSARDIIKHGDVCMLDTLSVTLGIQQGSLLLLNMEQKPDTLI